MRIEEELKLDFKDVLFRPKRSTLGSRAKVELKRAYKYRHSGRHSETVPIIAANMDTVGTFDMAAALAQRFVDVHGAIADGRMTPAVIAESIADFTPDTQLARVYRYHKEIQNSRFMMAAS